MTLINCTRRLAQDHHQMLQKERCRGIMLASRAVAIGVRIILTTREMQQPVDTHSLNRSTILIALVV